MTPLRRDLGLDLGWETQPPGALAPMICAAFDRMLAEQWLTLGETTCGAVPKSIELLEDRNRPAVRMRSTGNTYSRGDLNDFLIDSGLHLVCDVEVHSGWWPIWIENEQIPIDQLRFCLRYGDDLEPPSELWNYRVHVDLNAEGQPLPGATLHRVIDDRDDEREPIELEHQTRCVLDWIAHVGIKAARCRHTRSNALRGRRHRRPRRKTGQ